MIERTLQKRTYTIGESKPVTDLLSELKTQAADNKYRFLLAYQDDGVIWGYVKNKTLHLSSKEFLEEHLELESKKLWELRLFGDNGEWYVWRADGKLMSRAIVDGEGVVGTSLDESYVLWGTEVHADPKNGFYPVHESDLGIVHTPPVPMRARHGLNLIVRHYVDHDECGAAYVKASRLVDLKNGGEA